MIYVYFNEQDVLVKRVVNKYVSKSLPNKNDFNYVKLFYPEATISEIVDECYNLPLGEDKKIIVVDNASFLTGEKGKKKKKSEKLDELISYCKNPDMSVDLILMVYSSSILESSELVKVIKNTGTIKEVITPTEADWKNEIRRYFSLNHIEIDDDAVEELSRRIEGDYSRFSNETKKLASYSNGEKITLNIVRMLVAGTVETDVFSLSNALVRGNKKAALKIYNDLKIHNTDEVTLIGILANQFKFMDQVNYLSNRGMTNKQIANELKCNERRVQVTLATSLRGTNSNAIKRALDELYETSKAILTGKVNSSYAFKTFILNFSLR